MKRRDLIAGMTAAAVATDISFARFRRIARPGLYDCEGCEVVGERTPSALGSVVRVAPRGEPGTPLVLSGRTLHANSGKPVAGVVIYAHHTDTKGYYSRGRPGSEWSLRHVLLRGWARSDAAGRFTFLTIKPAPYPGRDLPGHIHLFVGEPGRRPYYVDDVVFAGEFGVNPRYIASQELRGGSGIVRLERRADGSLACARDIVLERHPA